jgi:AcrR family transcriptional regulator
MFKKTTTKAQATREHLLETALGLFLEMGFDSATMRDIGKAAGLALGAAYYYFPSKEAIVMAYYDRVQEQHLEQVTAGLAKTTTLRERLGLAFHSKLEILSEHRALIGTLLGFVGKPVHPLSQFGKGTQTQRQQSINTFKLALGNANLPTDISDFAPAGFWMLHNAMLLYFVHDTSDNQARTHKLVDDTLDLVVQFLEMSASPFLQPMLEPIRKRVLEMLSQAELLPERSVHHE